MLHLLYVYLGMVNVLRNFQTMTHEYKQIKVIKGCEALIHVEKLHVKAYYIFILLCTCKIHNLVY